MLRPVLAATLALTFLSFARADILPKDKRSGFDFMSPQTQAMQSDETSNPGMLWVLDGERLWGEPQGSAGKSCASCHEDATKGMRGVAARYPVFDEQSKRPIDLAGRINRCRQTRQAAPPLAHESNELLNLTAYVAYQSHGMPVAPATDPRLEKFRENGRAWFERRLGQLQLSCASCHDDRWGARLGGSIIPQAHPTGYPLYRLEWQTVGSLQRRLRGCLVGVRAEPFEYGAPEYIDIELFLMSRASGLKMETPAVRP
ncbi:MAG TPA: sulfur oxidation c-type cytochrome SoxA [Steroidobacter sp.]|uniref:sulfur oxidation c-type cytochrome SoxA n=1 Tax=Steroidobacter sp. TaxID=1978227 RepID=UPI002EDAE598